METQYKRVHKELTKRIEENPEEIFSIHTVLSFQKKEDRDIKYRTEKSTTFRELLSAGKIKVVNLISDNNGAPTPYYQNIKGSKPALKILSVKDEEFQKLDLFMISEYCELHRLSVAVKKRLNEILRENKIPAYVVQGKRYTYRYKKKDIEKAIDQYNKETGKGIQLGLGIVKTPMPTTVKMDTPVSSEVPLQKVSKRNRKSDTYSKILALYESSPDEAYTSEEVSNLINISHARTKVIIRELIFAGHLKVTKVEGDTFLTVSYQGRNGHMPEIPVTDNPSKEYNRLGLTSVSSFCKEHKLSASQSGFIRIQVNTGKVTPYLIKDNERGYFWHYKKSDLYSLLLENSKGSSKKRTYSNHEESKQPVVPTVTPVVQEEVKQPVVKTVTPVVHQEAPLTKETSLVKKLFSLNLLGFTLTLSKKKKETISNSEEDSIEI